MENWKPIPGYTGFEASDLGRIRNKQGKVRKGHMERGYHVISIRADHERYGRNRRIHRLVCMAFHGLPTPEKPMALHKDDDKDNNTPDNLYWGDARDNFKDAVGNGKIICISQR